MLRMYNVGCKLLSGIQSMYVDSSACVRVKEGESEWFRIDNWVRQGCIMSPWLFIIYMGGMIKEVKMGMGRMGESGDCLASCIQMNCGESEEDLRVMVGQFAEMCKKGQD